MRCTYNCVSPICTQTTAVVLHAAWKIIPVSAQKYTNCFRSACESIPPHLCCTAPAPMWPEGRVHRQQSDSGWVSYLSGCFSSGVRMSFMLPNKCPQFSSRLNANTSFKGSAIKRCFFTWMQPRINFHRGRPDLDTYVYTWDMLLLWATTATGRPKIETGSSIGEQNNTLKPATLNATAKKRENKGIL